MADVTINELTRGTPAGSALIPYSTGNSTLSVPVSSLLTNTNTALNTRRIVHSSVNTSAATTNFLGNTNSGYNYTYNNPSPTHTDATQAGDTWSYSYQLFANTGGYSACPNAYYVVCPLQKNLPTGTNTPAFGTVEFFGCHRGIWASPYGLYHKFNVAVTADSGGITLVSSQRGTPGTANGLPNLRHLPMNYDGVVTESAGFGTNIGVNIGNSFYGWYHPFTVTGQTPLPVAAGLQIPFLFKIYTHCGADEMWYIKVTTTNPDVLGPPFKGAVMMAANTMPTQSMYVNV